MLQEALHFLPSIDNHLQGLFSELRTQGVEKPSTRTRYDLLYLRQRRVGQ